MNAKVHTGKSVHMRLLYFSLPYKIAPIEKPHFIFVRVFSTEKYDLCEGILKGLVTRSNNYNDKWRVLLKNFKKSLNLHLCIVVVYFV